MTWAICGSVLFVGGLLFYHHVLYMGRQIERQKENEHNKKTLEKRAYIDDRMRHDRDFIKRVRARFTR